MGRAMSENATAKFDKTICDKRGGGWADITDRGHGKIMF